MILSYELPLLKALDTKSIPKEFAFQATGMHFRSETGVPTCDVVLDVPLGNLTMQQEKGAAQSQGKVAYVAMVKDIGAAGALERIQYVATAPVDKLEAGNYQVRFIGRQGTLQVNPSFGEAPGRPWNQ